MSKKMADAMECRRQRVINMPAVRRSATANLTRRLGSRIYRKLENAIRLLLPDMYAFALFPVFTTMDHSKLVKNVVL